MIPLVPYSTLYFVCMALGNKHMASKALVYFWLSAILLFIELSYPMALIL